MSIDDRKLPIGAYWIFWKGDSKPSLAAVGVRYDGRKWFAPCNWTTSSVDAKFEAWSDWTKVDRVEPILVLNGQGRVDTTNLKPYAERLFTDVTSILEVTSRMNEGNDARARSLAVIEMYLATVASLARNEASDTLPPEPLQKSEPLTVEAFANRLIVILESKVRELRVLASNHYIAGAFEVLEKAIQQAARLEPVPNKLFIETRRTVSKADFHTEFLASEREFHEAWGRAAMRPDYDKEAWKEVQLERERAWRSDATALGITGPLNPIDRVK